MTSVSPVIYVPPTQADALNLSREACGALASSTGDTRFADEDIVFGLANFLQTCGKSLPVEKNRGLE